MVKLSSSHRVIPSVARDLPVLAPRYLREVLRCALDDRKRGDDSKQGMHLMSQVLSTNQLTIAFTDDSRAITAVENLSLTLNEGETLAIIGESGSGKSITALSLMRLLPKTAAVSVESQVLFDNKDLLSLPEAMMRLFRGKRLAIIFQEPMTALNPVLTIRQQLTEACPKATPITDEILLGLLKEVELPDSALFLNRYPHQLSGGQKQRIIIAMALAGNPEVLIADEPTTALDVTVQAQILNLIRRIQQKHRMALVLITHDLTIAEKMATHIAVMYVGCVVEYAPIADFFKTMLHPYSKQLLEALPSYAKRDKLLQTIPGKVPAINKKPAGCHFHPRCAYVLPQCSTIVPDKTLMNHGFVYCHHYPEKSQLPVLDIKPIFLPKLTPETLPILTVSDLHVRYQKSTIDAVDSVSFELKKGQTLALVGESGCGKSTIAKTLIGLQAMTSGEILFKHQRLSRMRAKPLKAYRQKMQMIFQDPYASLNPRWTVYDILTEGLVASGLTHRAIQKKLPNLLESVHLSSQSIHRYPHQFSGGQRQRIAIARALALEPEILICDEPTSALDVSVQAKILNLLKTLQHEHGLSYLFITHNFEVVSYMADEVLVMHQGKIVERGAVDEILFNAKHPYTQQLIAAVKQMAIMC